VNQSEQGYTQKLPHCNDNRVSSFPRDVGPTERMTYSKIISIVHHLETNIPQGQLKSIHARELCRALQCLSTHYSSRTQSHEEATASKNITANSRGNNNNNNNIRLSQLPGELARTILRRLTLEEELRCHNPSNQELVSGHDGDSVASPLTFVDANSYHNVSQWR